MKSLPLDHLLSKVSSLRPLVLDPNVLATRTDDSTFTACMWTTEGELDMIVPWAERWSGKILVYCGVRPASRLQVL